MNIDTNSNYLGNNPRMTLKELMKELDYKTTSSVRRWCNKNKINIHQEGQKRYIYRVNWFNINQQNIICEFKEKYGEKWEYAMELASKNELYKLEKKYEPISIHSISNYKPKSTAAKNLLRL